MKHPVETQLALYAGGDLGRWEGWKIGRHVSHCAVCSQDVQAMRAATGQVREFAAELPKDLNWNRLAEEMSGNIRVGLAAGEAIARFDRPAAAKPLRLGWHAALVAAGATLVFLIAFWSSLPPQQADHLLTALKRIRTERIGMLLRNPAALTAPEGVVLEASSAGIEVKENGSAMSLMHPHSDSATVSVGLDGSAGVHFVDADTGQVTTNKVYYAEQ